MTHNFGRYPRREIAMSHPVPITPVEDNYGHVSIGVLPPAPRLPSHTAFRGAHAV